MGLKKIPVIRTRTRKPWNAVGQQRERRGRSRQHGQRPDGDGTATGKRSALPQIRFQPDGGINESSVESVRLTDREGDSRWLALSRSRLNYEIHNQAEQRAAARR